MLDSVYLAMTAAELDTVQNLPKKLAYMACHFSPYGTGLSNFPDTLPPDSLLILNDRTPICGHDKTLIAKQLNQLCEDFGCRGILLDLQRPNDPQNRELVEALCHVFPGRIAVSHLYAKGLTCPVFLPPLPVGQTLNAHIAPWSGRELWLDLCGDAAQVTVKSEGSKWEAQLPYEPDGLPFYHDSLHCSYRIAVQQDRAEFFLCRSAAHLPRLMEEGKSLGITCFMGLYQELKEIAPRE